MKQLTVGQQNGLRAKWWYSGWARALTNLPEKSGSPNKKENKIITRVMKCSVRKDINITMGWWPES